MTSAADLATIRWFNDSVNRLLLPASLADGLELALGSSCGHYLTTYCRDLIAATALYWLSGAAFCLYAYTGTRHFEDKGLARPTFAIMKDQMLWAQQSVIFFTMVPVLSSWMIQTGLTRTYWTVNGTAEGLMVVVWTILYFAFVEVGVYWAHRTLHTNKWMYRNLHVSHHKYKEAADLTPWASFAFHPLDGLYQACPYLLVLIFCPCHYLAHTLLMFFSAVWAANLHDGTIANMDPVMGSKYHTIHHTHCHYNYGHVFTFCDRFWGTLRVDDATLQASFKLPRADKRD